MKQKTCKGCGETKPLTDFNKHPQCKDGRKGKCKTCISEQRKKLYREARNSPAIWAALQAKARESYQAKKRAK